MNVLHVIETLEVGGAENVVVNLINRLSDRFRPTICCLKRSGPVAARLSRKEVEVVELRKKEGNDYSIPFKLAKVLRDRRISVIHSHNWATYCESVSASILARTPTRIHMVHGESFYPDDTVARALKKSVRLFAEGSLAHWVDAIVAVSDQARRSLLSERSIDPRKVTVVRNGVEPVRTDPASLPAKRRELGLSGDEIVLVAVGRVAEVKNYPFLVESFAGLKRSTARKVKLLIVGDGPEMASLRSLAADSGCAQDILLPGSRSDVRELLALSHIYVLPSKSEGVSIALLEAMSMKLPAVATRVGGNVEVVSDEETGLLVESGDAAGLSRSLLRLVEDEAERGRMGQAGFRKVREQFDLGRSVRAFEELYIGAARRRAA